MSTVVVSDIPLDSPSPAQRLREMAAATRIMIHWWGTHKSLTTQQKEEVGAAYDADIRFLTAGKKILDTRHQAFRRLTSVRTRLVNYWRVVTLPYTDPGVRLLRQSDLEAFVHCMEGFRDELADGEVELNSVYDQLKTDARRRLGRLFNPADYPSEVQGLFGLEWDFPSVEPPSYLMRINPEIYQQEQERIARRFEEAVQLAEQAFISEFGRLLSHLTQRLTNDENGERRIFRDSAVTNLSEFFQRFQALNVRSNHDLDRLVEQAQQLVNGITPQDLRDDGHLRRQIATDMTQVQTQLDGMIVERPRRQIIRSNPLGASNGVNHANGV
jgi:hypothetical protein